MVEDRADAFLHMIRRTQRGRLKVYLGYCAGVGKTYQMLIEAHRLRDEGIDIVVGLVETHGRYETAALLNGLEIIPRRRHEYRGIKVEEMDVDAILARKPQVALVDELAHTNVPGSRNAKRYQDVQDLLAAGIHIISTLNVQHFESLYDTVEKVAGIKVRERLPDTVIADADAIVNVDLTTEDLRKRLEEGKVYPKERIGTALENFFRKANLEQLRELTLREVASQIDLKRRETLENEVPPTPDQVMVCLSSRGPNSEKLLRYASRLAGRLNRNWYAVYVQTPSEEPTVIDAQTLRILSTTLTLAKQLGAMVFTYKGEDVVDTVLRFAKEYRVGQIVIGSPGPLSFWNRLLRKKNLVERLIDKAKGITVVVLDTRKYERLADNGAFESAIVRPVHPQSPVHLAPHPVLSRLLSADRIIIWEEPAGKEEVLRELVAGVGKNGELSNLGSVLQNVIENEQQTSTFLNEGVAFPHARLNGLSSPVVALGLTRGGVVDATRENCIDCVFLILTPAELPETQLQILALASRAARSRHLLQNLRSSRTAQEALAAIGDWETQQEPSRFDQVM